MEHRRWGRSSYSGSSQRVSFGCRGGAKRSVLPLSSQTSRGLPRLRHIWAFKIGATGNSQTAGCNGSPRLRSCLPSLDMGSVRHGSSCFSKKKKAWK
jgi:hypothetical protein